MSTDAGISPRKLGIIAVVFAALLAAASVGTYFGVAANSGGTAQQHRTRAAQSVEKALGTRSIDRAQVTGYTQISASGPPSGPVSVRLRGAAAAGLYRTIEGLRAGNPIDCAEEATVYRITFTSAVGVVDVTGDECAGLVSMTVGTSDTRDTDWTDGGCTLLTAVRRVLPATATATQGPGVPCAP